MTFKHSDSLSRLKDVKEDKFNHQHDGEVYKFKDESIEVMNEFKRKVKVPLHYKVVVLNYSRDQLQIAIVYRADGQLNWCLKNVVLDELDIPKEIVCAKEESFDLQNFTEYPIHAYTKKMLGRTTLNITNLILNRPQLEINLDYDFVCFLDPFTNKLQPMDSTSIYFLVRERRGDRKYSVMSYSQNIYQIDNA